MKHVSARTDLASWIDDLVAAGRSSFSTEEAREVHGGTDKAVQASLRRLRAKSEIASPLRGFHLVLSPEYRRLGCLPPLWFADDLAQHLGLPYYVALLSAAELHGAAHQRPQTFQVMLPRTHRPVVCGGVSLGFAMRANLGQMPVAVRNTPKGTVRVASPEVTAFDLIGYPHHAGGLDHVAVVLGELAENLDPAALMRVACLSPPPWAQRLGFMLDRVGASDGAEALALWVKDQAPPSCTLDVERSSQGAPRDNRWRLLVNTVVEVEP